VVSNSYQSKAQINCDLKELTSKTMKRIRPTAFRTNENQKSHQEAVLGKRRVKQRLGWSSRNRSSSQTPRFSGTIFEIVQMNSRSVNGKPVCPAMMRIAPTNRGTTAVRNEIIESGVSVYPQSVNIDPGVKIPLR
jgi:hypothetical protein